MTTKKTSRKKPATAAKSAGAKRKSAPRQRTGQPAEPATAGEEPQTAEQAVAPETTTKKKSRPAARRRKAPRAQSKAAGRAVKPLSAGAEMEEGNGEIVIRFPPAAASPFARAPAADGPRLEVVAAPPQVAEPEPEPEPEPPTAKEEVALAPPVAAQAPTVEDLEAEAKRALSRSQKRRRRRRGRGRKDKDQTAPAEREPSTAAEQSATDTPTTGFQAENEIEDLEEEPAPWLDDVDVLGDEPDRIEIAEAEAAEPEVIEPEVIEPEPEEPAAEPESEAPAKDKAPRRRRRGRRGARGKASEAPGEGSEEPAAAAAVATARTAKAASQPKREMIINTVQREECRIAILNEGRLEEIYLERATSENHVGNIYKGKVTNVEPSIQAAFVDFGQGKNGFLHISDLHPEYFPDGAGQTENVGRKMPRRSRPPIQRCLRRGQEVLVQVTKEGIGTKGPTLSTYLSIPGRFLVMMPGMRRLGVSRRIEDEEARAKLRENLNGLELPEGIGFIARTAALDRTQRELQNDLSYLTRLWRAVTKRIENDPAPAELYRESDLVIRTIRDVFTADIGRIVVDDQEVMERAREFLSIFSPRSQDLVTLYTDPEPIFHKLKIEAELERLHSRHVPLRSGGSLVIDQTEALVAIDVNSGRFRTEDDAETTAFKINCEAADEIPRQLRLRDLGGVVVCDFIDMRLDRHRREVERRLIQNLKEHKERAKVLRTSAFGLIELTRQRQRASLTRSIYRDCRHCRGTGLIKTVESVTLDVMRLVQLAVTRENIRMVEVSVSPDVAYLLQNRKRKMIHTLEERHRRVVSIRPDPGFSRDQVEIACTDARGRVVPHT